ncbi:MAG: ATP-binding protein [Cyclobacteriaceae bacterium]
MTLYKIAIVGPESSGKSRLASELARDYTSEWVPEFARFYLDRLDRPYTQDDLLQIAKAQVNWESEKAEYANKYLFCDTTLLVIKIWSEIKYGKVDRWIVEQLEHQHYDHYLLCDVDLPWQPDEQREHPDLGDRKMLFTLYKDYLESGNYNYTIVSGIEGDRLNAAMQGISYLK